MADPAEQEPEHRRLGTGNVLLVEDEENLRRAAARMLKSMGYTVFETGSGPEARPKLTHRPSGFRQSSEPGKTARPTVGRSLAEIGAALPQPS